MAKLSTIGTKTTKATLTKLSVDPELDHFMVVSFWKDNTITTGWSTGIKHNELCFGATILQEHINNEIFNEEMN